VHGMNTARTRASQLAEGRHSSWIVTTRTKLRIAPGIGARRRASLEMQGVTRDALHNSVETTRNRRSWPSRRWLERSAAVMLGCCCLALSACGGTRSTPTPAVTPTLRHVSVASSHGSVQLVYSAEPSARARAVTRGALERTVEVIRARLRALGIGAARVSVSGANEITVSLPNVRDTAQAEREVGRTAQLSFYDWEANALMPNGKTVASQLPARDPAAIEISQGSGPAPAGSPGAGSMRLYDAVQLASKQRYRASRADSRIGSQYWLFGAPGSAACATAARDRGTTPFAGQHCLLSGPDETLNDLVTGLPAGVSASEGEILTVPRGTVVLQAIPASFADPVPIGDPTAQFFVLKDHVALQSRYITNPLQSTDPNTGTPNITFGFTSKGKIEFQNVTAAVTRRGSLVSGLGQSLNQHFAVALDDELITVPFIDFKQFPDGINGDVGAEISGSFSSTSARDLANELRFGALPLNLELICHGAPATTPCHSPRVP
jgi:SecD/SecF fusion protein